VAAKSTRPVWLEYPAIDMKIIMQGLNAVIRELNDIPREMEQARKRAHYRIAVRVHAQARRNAPISPNQEQKDKLKKTKRKGKKKKKDATSRAKPTGLTNSIEFAHNAKQAEIFLPSNAPAGKGYGYIIHEEKGKTWHKRGPGTVAKGPQADDKFIERAVMKADKEGSIRRIYASEVAKGLKPDR
jgi:hypothetical protein